MLADYGLRKKHHLCVTCGKQDAYTLNGRARCFECNEKQNACLRRHPEYAERKAKKDREIYAKRKEGGICTKCGKARAEIGKAKCKGCLAKDAAAHRVDGISHVQAPEYGLCHNCCKEECKPGFKLCEVCYEKSLKSLILARANRELKKNFVFGKAMGW